MARLFIAVWPPAAVIRDLTELRSNERGLKFVRPENWHITLRFFGRAEASEVTEALSDTSFESARAELGPVEILAARALVVRVHGLDALAALVTRTHTEDRRSAASNVHRPPHLGVPREVRAAHCGRNSGSACDLGVRR